ncbi:MAG: hypothetical protein LW688_12155 [Cryomorphaceae bacterium]|jgi:hypothetical protein|nr:hypothetical protein [Cryomorphaceae bacterium]
MIDQQGIKRPSSSLNVLCILTLIGSVFILLKGLITYFILVDSNDTRSESGILFINLVYFLEFMSCIGSIVGAILMLSRKKAGLVVYLISSILYIALTTVFAIFCFFSIIGIPVGILQFFYLAPAILFLILYLNQANHLS